MEKASYINLQQQTNRDKQRVILILLGSGSGSVGRAVASNARGLRLESSHRRNLIYFFTDNCVEKTKINKKEAGNGPFLTFNCFST